MIVCLCRAVSDRTVKAVVRGGAETVAQVGRACGAGGECGSCRPQIAQMITEHHGSCADCPRARGGVPCANLEPVGDAA